MNTVEDLINLLKEKYSIYEILRYTDLLTNNLIFQIYLEYNNKKKTIGIAINSLEEINFDKVLEEIEKNLE